MHRFEWCQSTESIWEEPEHGTFFRTTLRSMQQPMRWISWAASLGLPLPVDNNSEFIVVSSTHIKYVWQIINEVILYKFSYSLYICSSCKVIYVERNMQMSSDLVTNRISLLDSRLHPAHRKYERFFCTIRIGLKYLSTCIGHNNQNNDVKVARVCGL